MKCNSVGERERTQCKVHKGLILPILASTEPVRALTHVIMLSEQAGWQSEKSRLLLLASPTVMPQTDPVRTQPHWLCSHFTLT